MASIGGGISDQIRIPDLIAKKRDGDSLSKNEIEFFVKAVVETNMDPLQIGAWLMAVYIHGLTDDETTYLTGAMKESGKVLKWPEEWSKKFKLVDKHSTGGVGDKVSLVLSPALAACGMKVPMMSGRGLEHTGGTLDKLEAIPGFNVFLDAAKITKAVDEVGCCIVGQTGELVPADKEIYKARDVTSTVKSTCLIVSSIISKKAAETLDALILDVKFGKGAFMKSIGEARDLAERMVAAANGNNVKTMALLTTMDYPLGYMVGNALEVIESIRCLHGNGPDELTDIVAKTGGHLLYTAGEAKNPEEGANMIKSTLSNGEALAKFKAMMMFQGVSASDAEKLCNKDFSILPKAKDVTDLQSESSGYVHEIDAMNCALVSVKLGAGREKAEDKIKFAVGLELTTTIGEKIQKGDVWIKVHHDDTLSDELLNQLKSALVVRSEPIERPQSRVVEVVQAK